MITGSIAVLAAPAGAYAADSATTNSSNSSTPTSSQSLTPKSSGENERAHEVDLRIRSGLRNDPEWVDSVDAAPTSTSDELGIPLTPAESADIRGRDRLNAVLGQIEGQAGKSELFGGVAIDQASGGAIKLALTADPAKSVAAHALLDGLKALVPQGVAVEVTVQDASLAQLDRAYNTISSDFAAGELGEFKITTVGEFGSSIDITTSSGSPQDVQTALRSRYGASFITVAEGAGVNLQASRSQTSGPVYGGIQISADEGSGCTSGFSSTKGGSTGSSFYDITAGHCGPPGYHWYEGSGATGDHFGTATVNNGYYNGGTSKCDCQSIGPVPAGAATGDFLSSNNVVSAQMTSLPTNTNNSAGYGDGRRICVSGAYYGLAHGGDLECGYINGRNFTDSFSGITFINLITTDANNTISGDSGGTVISGSNFMGIHQGLTSDGTNEIFSRSVYIASVTGATPLF